MRTAVVPNRNMIFMAVAAAYALSHGCDSIAIGAHEGAETIYVDSSSPFLNAMDRAFELCDNTPVQLYRPFVHFLKEDIIIKGARLHVPFEETWTCYENHEHHCGVCSTCVSRRESFIRAGITDPTIYES